MTQEQGNDPAKRMRKLLNAAKPPALSKLPKKEDGPLSGLPKQEGVESAGKKTPQPKPKPASVTPKINLNLNRIKERVRSTLKFGPPFWNIASTISLTFNIIFIIILLSLGIGLKKYGLNIGGVLNLGDSLLGGLYSNFEKMDRASIKTEVKVETTIPVKFDLQLNKQTEVVLSQDVTITNARVTVNTGGLNITNALTTIVLPQGTSLPVVLNLTVPVDTSIPVTLTVPVDIPLDQTELHEPFTGLQDVIRPLYCLINSNAKSLDGRTICK